MRDTDRKRKQSTKPYKQVVLQGKQQTKKTHIKLCYLVAFPLFTFFFLFFVRLVIRNILFKSHTEEKKKKEEWENQKKKKCKKVRVSVCATIVQCSRRISTQPSRAADQATGTRIEQCFDPAQALKKKKKRDFLSLLTNIRSFKQAHRVLGVKLAFCFTHAPCITSTH